MKIGESSIQKDGNILSLTFLTCLVKVLLCDNFLSFNCIFMKIVPPHNELIIVGNRAINKLIPVPQPAFLQLRMPLRISNKNIAAQARLTKPQILKIT